jgi:hypothetical protein
VGCVTPSSAATSGRTTASAPLSCSTSQSLRCERSHEQPGELLAHAFGSDALERGCCAGQRIPGGRLKLEAELGDEAGRADDAQGVFGEALGRVAGRSEEAALQVRSPADGVEQRAGREVYPDRVDREVALGRIGGEALAERRSGSASGR